ncbi:MAG TPA: adenylate/guanylate cyclase domain-containing protein, partial [Chloroflexota bacterium]|nr:adenylate/guanylate cyclase domain-containing protein [Chloroflexota bacterium]
MPKISTRAPRESRRIVTALFADIVGYTSMVETHSERTETVRALLQECFDGLAPIVLDFGGIVEKFIGDAICALFGAPAVHEDDPQRALACALAMQAAMDRMAETRGGADGHDGLPPMSLRIGISTGEVVGGTAKQGGQEQYSVTGDAVNTASRLQASAQSGQILVSAATERLARATFAFEPIGEIKLKGKRSPLHTFVLLGEREPGARAGDIDLVNRRKEMAHLDYCLELAAQGDPQLVELTGDAGVGKSRLVEAFAEHVSDSALVSRGSCPPQAAAPVHPFMTVARDLLVGISALGGPADTPTEMIGVLEEVAAGTIPVDLEEPAHAIASAMQQAVHAISYARPVLILVENVHRADPESLDLLQHLIARIRDERLMLAWTRRTGEEMPLEGDYHVAFTRIPLKPLADRDAEYLLRQLLGDTPVPAQLQRLVVERSAGNPLYIEAMVRAILDDGDLLARPEVASLEVPTTVHGLIQSRLDSFPEAQRLVAQEAAVAGREFDARLLQEVDLFGIDVLPALEALTRRGMIESMGGTTYRFRHVLTQEVC